MVLFRFDLTFYGENFVPEPFAATFEAQGVKVEWCSENNEKAFSYLSVAPAKEFSTQLNVDNHLHWFCTLLNENYLALQAGGVEKTVLFTEVFYEGGQCNMELFNHEFYACAHRCALYTPLSAYKISQVEWNKMERECRDAYAEPF
jgi:hypothetical protein